MIAQYSRVRQKDAEAATRRTEKDLEDRREWEARVASERAEHERVLQERCAIVCRRGGGGGVTGVAVRWLGREIVCEFCRTIVLMPFFTDFCVLPPSIFW